MFQAEKLYRELLDHGVDFFVGVPDTVIMDFCNYLVQNVTHGNHVITANEGGAVAMAAGHYLGSGGIPVVYMQNSGIGNAVNPLLSLADSEVFAIPMILLVGWRGEPGLHDEPQHCKQGRVTIPLAESMDIPFGIIEPDWDRTQQAVSEAFAVMRERPGPYLLLVRNGCFEPFPATPAGHNEPDMTREAAIEIIAGFLPPETAYVASTGMGPRELFELRARNGQPHASDFLNAGAMGHASLIAAGAAMVKPEQKVVCLDGDGAFFMHMGAAALIPTLHCGNLMHIVLNNGVHDSVGGQPNLGMISDLPAIAQAVGYPRVFSTSCRKELRSILAACQANDGPHFIEVKVARGFRRDLGRPTIPFQTAAQEFKVFLART